MALSLRFASFLTMAPRRRNAGTTMAFAAVAAPAVRRRNLYEVLQVRETASAAEIKAAYRSMAKRAHPDAALVAAAAAAGGCEEFLELRRAYETLSDPAARMRYDVSIGRLRVARTGRFGAPRRWETDQCW